MDVRQLYGTLDIVAKDVHRLLDDIRASGFMHDAETLTIDAVWIANAFGVPYTGTALKVLPYVFDVINALDSTKKPTLESFLTALADSSLNLDNLVFDIKTHDWEGVANIAIDDVLDIAGDFGVPYTGVAEFVINLAFKSGFVVDAVEVFSRGVEDLMGLEGVTPSVQYPGYQWDPLMGWVLVGAQ